MLAWLARASVLQVKEGSPPVVPLSQRPWLEEALRRKPASALGVVPVKVTSLAALGPWLTTVKTKLIRSNVEVGPTALTARSALFATGWSTGATATSMNPPVGGKLPLGRSCVGTCSATIFCRGVPTGWVGSMASRPMQ